MRQQATAVAPPATSARSVGWRGVAPVRDLLTTARPRQWVKNLLLYAALVFSTGTAWTWGDPGTWAPLLLAATAGFALFSVAASGGYLVNDALDAARDRAHPLKRLRPVACGRLARPVAAGLGVALMAAAAAAGLALDAGFGLVLLAYAVLSGAYSLALKRVVGLDVFTVATGFALRAVAGALVIDVPVSPWLYACTTLGALFVAVMKRRGEAALLARDAAVHRGALGGYSLPVLDRLASLSMAATIAAYALYATSAEGLPGGNAMLVTLPFVVYGMFRYRVIARRHPEQQADELILGDRSLLAGVLLFGSAALAVLALGR